jgi:hypothetical protein
MYESKNSGDSLESEIATSSSAGHCSNEWRFQSFDKVLSDKNDGDIFIVSGLISFSNMSKYFWQF